MKRHLAITALIFSVASVGFAADTVVEGTAKGAQSYSVVTSGKSQTVEAGRMTNLKVGDTVVANEEPVTVLLSDGSAVVVERNSSVTLEENAVVLGSGTAVVGFSPASEMTARYESLVVKSSKTDNAAPASVFLDATGESLVVESMTGNFTAIDSKTEAPVAEVAEGSSASMTSTESGWASVPAASTGFTGVRPAAVKPAGSVESVRTSTGSRAVLLNSGAPVGANNAPRMKEELISAF